MILYSDDYAAIAKAMDYEMEKVGYYVQKEWNAAKKLFYKTPTFPAWHYKIYTVPASQNKYLVWYYALHPREARDLTYFYGNCLLLNNNNGGLVAITKRRFKTWNDNYTAVHDNLSIYTGHFFSRYRERMWWSDGLSQYDVIASYLGRNVAFHQKIEADKLKTDKYKDSTAIRVDDGVVLGKEHNIPISDNRNLYVLICNTFLSEDILKEDQKPHVINRDILRKMILRGISEKDRAASFFNETTER